MIHSNCIEQLFAFCLCRASMPPLVYRCSCSLTIAASMQNSLFHPSLFSSLSTLLMLQMELEASRRGGMSSPSRSIASSLAESDCIPAFNPPSGAMPPSGAHKRPGMALLNFNGAKGLSDSPTASPASASKVITLGAIRRESHSCHLPG